MFADDTALFNSGSDPELVVSPLEKDLNIISRYFASLNLKLNVDKTKIDITFLQTVEKANY